MQCIENYVFCMSMGQQTMYEEVYWWNKKKMKRRKNTDLFMLPLTYYIFYRYIEPEPGMTAEQLMDIPYTKVE